MNDSDFIQLLMKNSLKMQNKEVGEMKKGMEDLRTKAGKAFDIDIPKPPQLSAILNYSNDTKRRDIYYDSKYHNRRYRH